MSFFKNFFGSLKKSYRLRKIQTKIFPLDLNANNIHHHFYTDVSKFEKEYFDLCETDKNIQAIMQKYNLSRDNLKKIYENLLNEGADQWKKGRFVALSTIAYPESLMFYLEAKNNKMSGPEIAYTLLQYGDNKIKIGQLHKEINSRTPAFAGVTEG
ncbi:MAG: hypothetical protein ACT4OY_00170 [Alphaproteobacteria bacterium]